VVSLGRLGGAPVQLSTAVHKKYHRSGDHETVRKWIDTRLSHPPAKCLVRRLPDENRLGARCSRSDLSGCGTEIGCPWHVYRPRTKDGVLRVLGPQRLSINMTMAAAAAAQPYCAICSCTRWSTLEGVQYTTTPPMITRCRRAPGQLCLISRYCYVHTPYAQGLYS
jgi:hypothetical protein